MIVLFYIYKGFGIIVMIFVGNFIFLLIIIYDNDVKVICLVIVLLKNYEF